MIKINKGPVPTDLDRTNMLAQDWLENHDLLDQDDDNARAKSIKQFRSNKKLQLDSAHYAPPLAKRQLYISHFGKCAYCESRIIHTQYGDVEHIRPKNGVYIRERDGAQTVANEGYFFKAFCWDNLLLSCGSCNQIYKKNFFPIMPDKYDEVSAEELSYLGEGELALQSVDYVYADSSNPYYREQAILVDPTNEDPRTSMFFDHRTGEAAPRSIGGIKSGRAGQTIFVLGLNRLTLVERRCKHLLMLHGLFLCAMNLQSCLSLIYAFGEKYKSDWTLATQWQKVHDALAPQAVNCVFTKALKVLALAVHPGAEYSALAADAICEWCKEEVENRTRTMTALAATQAPQAYIPSMGASHNMRLQIPGWMSAALDIQLITDYAKIVENYCNERGLGVPLQPARVEIYRQMNLLINNVSANFEALIKLEKEKDNRFLALKNHAEEFMAELRGDAENEIDVDMDDDAKPAATAPVALNANDQARAYLCTACEPLVTFTKNATAWNPDSFRTAEQESWTRIVMTPLTPHWFEQLERFHQVFQAILNQNSDAMAKRNQDSLAVISTEFDHIEAELTNLASDARKQDVHTDAFKSKRIEIEAAMRLAKKKINSASSSGKPPKVKNPHISPIAAR